jgi:hypothetical protein
MEQPNRAGQTFRLRSHACHMLQRLGGTRWNRLREPGAMSDPASIARYRAACQTASGCAARGSANIRPQTRLPGTVRVIIGEACWLRSLPSNIPAHLVCVQEWRSPSFSAATCAFRTSMSASCPNPQTLSNALKRSKFPETGRQDDARRDNSQPPIKRQMSSK